MARSDTSDLEWEFTKVVLPNKTRGKKRVDAVRIALPSGLTRRQGASDLGIGLSTLNEWITTHRDTDVVSDKDLDLARENEWLRRENRILKEERDILKKTTAFFTSQKPRGSWQTRGEAELAIFQYIKRFYNPPRRHSALGWKSPVAFERKVG